jgi:broad specificity phosphatase PhoE
LSQIAKVLGLALLLAACTREESDPVEVPLTVPRPATTPTPTAVPRPTPKTPPPGAVILVRHAEKAGGEGGDPPLSPVGRARAKELAHMLEKTGVTAIYASQYQRAQQTASPLAEHLRLPVHTVQASDLDGTVREVRSNPGGTVLVVGHSDSVVSLIEMLGGGKVEPIGAEDYDNLYVLTFDPTGRVKVLCLRYGAAASGKGP